MEPWRTAISSSDENHIWIRGRDITSLMTQATFTETIFLLHQGRLPSVEERRLLDAIFIAVIDHGPGSPSAAAARRVASGNRQAPEAAVAAGVLAVGDAHAGAGTACMEMIRRGLDTARRDSLSIEEAARREVVQAVETKQRIPGLGHRFHSQDPRTTVLFDMARRSNLAGDGIRFIQAVHAAAAAKIKPMPINVDGALAGVLYDLGLPPALGKLFFIIGRTAGLTAQVMEEYTREKPMRVHIPVIYDGQ